MGCAHEICRYRVTVPIGIILSTFFMSPGGVIETSRSYLLNQLCALPTVRQRQDKGISSEIFRRQGYFSSHVPTLEICVNSVLPLYTFAAHCFKDGIL